MKHILIVDDVTTNLKCAAEVLRDAYEITTAKSGGQVLQLLKKQVPDLILLDIDMPDMDGYEVMEQLKLDEALKDIPVVFLTTGTDKESEFKGLKMGAMDFIRKPFDPEVMRSRINKILQLTEQRKELQDIAQKDDLTNLLNRRYMENLVNQADNREEKGYFLLLDLDNFKLVNDTIGHMVGDEVLVKFAEVLKKEVGEEGSVCRLGGDEFVIYIPGEHNKEKLKNTARRVIAGIEFEMNQMLSYSYELKVSVSIGIAEKPEDGSSFNELYSAADKALYYVKQSGKRGFHFFRDTEKESWKAQLVLFTVQDVFDNEIDSKRVEKAIRSLEESVSKSLRRGDVAVRCGNVQYVAILINASYEDGMFAAQRIRQKFDELLGDESMELIYEMQSVGDTE